MNRSKSFLERRKTELWITSGLILAIAGLVAYSLKGEPLSTEEVSFKIAAAVFVALTVRWLSIWFDEKEYRVDKYESTRAAYITDLERARKSVWILQTWLPGTDQHAEWIAKSSAPKKLIVLGSLRDSGAEHYPSPMHARIAGRKMELEIARGHIAQSLVPLVDADPRPEIRFNFGHHPGWIAVVDEKVYWGFTPCHEDNQTKDWYFHVDAVDGRWGRFWLDQFDRIWRHSTHSYDKERSYNSYLPQYKALSKAMRTDRPLADS